MGVFLRPDFNLIRKKDIHTRRELWKQKVKLLDLKKFDKDFWDKSYEFLPLPKTYQRIRDKVKEWIDKNKEAEGKFLELQKKAGEELIKLAQEAQGFVRNEADELGLFEPEERPQPDLGRLKELRKGAIALGRNNWEQLERVNQESLQSEEIAGLVEEWKEIKEELREPAYILWHENNVLTFMWWNEKGVDLGLEKYGFLYRNKLYWVERFVYIDNAKLYCRVEARVDLIYLYYANYLRGSGVIKLKRAPLFQEDLENPLAKSNKLHYPFCDDKGNLAMIEANTVEHPGWQPSLKTFVLDLKRDVGTGRINKKRFFSNGNSIEIPTQLKLADLSTPGGIWDFLSGWVSSATGDQTLAFLAPADFPQMSEDNGMPSLFYNNYAVTKINDEGKIEGDFVKVPLPDIFTKHPHLIHESTVQVFFLKKMIHHGFLNQFHLEAENQTNPDGNNIGKTLYLKYLCQTRANPSGIYYLFTSKTQFWKAELSVSQVFKTQTLMQKVREGTMSYFAKRGDLLDFVGLNDDVPDEKPKNEQNAKRTYTNTNKNSKNRPKITPDLLYPNTVDLKYDFFEFANRYIYPFLVFRFQYSNDLRNNLRNCNNKSHEFDLDLTFAQLGVLINKPGEYQGDLKLKEDNNGLMKEIFAKSVFFYEDLEKDLVNPDLKLLEERNTISYGIDDAEIHVGEETMSSATFTHQISYQADRREYAHATWFCFSDGEVQESFKRACSCSFSHYYNSAPSTTTTGWCWGCTYDDLARSNFLATSFTPVRDCQFVYCLEVGMTPTTRQLTAGTNYHFTFTPTDILISWSVHTTNTEVLETPTINTDSLQEEQQPDQTEELADLSDLEENEDEGEVSEQGEQEEEETEDESENEEEAEESESESEDDEDEEEESSEESEDEEEESSEDDEDDDEESEEE